jgi:ribosomal protein S15P/S13E
MSKLKYLTAVVIVHGKSELQLCSFIKSNLKLKIHIESDKKDEK